MKDLVKSIFVILIIIIGLLGTLWVVEGNDFFLYQYFAPKQEQVRRNVYENSVSYNQGMIQDLEDMQVQYLDPKTDKDQKDALKNIIIERSTKFDMNKAPADLRNFVDKLKRGDI